MVTSEIILAAQKAHRYYLTEIESKQLLWTAGINVNEVILAKSSEEAASIARKMGYPVVLKIISKDVIHKTDVGGVKLNLANKQQIIKSYNDIISSVKHLVPEAVIDGVSVQRMARPGVEVIIGMFKDPQFGPVLMFGIGGELVEIYKDVSFGIVPVSRRWASQMIKDIKGYALLDGFRGREKANIQLLEGMLLKLSDFVEKNPQIKEIDLNPVIAYSDDALVIDARVILESAS